MKKLLIIAAAGFFFTASAQAQITRSTDATQKVRSEKGHRMMASMTDTQKSQMKEMRDDFKTKREAISKDPNLSEEQRKSKMRELSQEERSKLNGILTPEQRANIKQYRNDKQEKVDKGAKMKDLNLTEAQKTKMNDLRKQFKNESDAVKNNSSLSDQDKKQRLSEIRKSQQDQMKQILTPDQQTKMKTYKGNRSKVKGNKAFKNKKEQHKPNKNS